MKRKKLKMITATAFCMVALLSVGIFYNNIVSFLNQDKDSTKVPSGFSITANAAENEPHLLSEVKSELNSEVGNGIKGADIVYKNIDDERATVKVEPIWFSMQGEDVETFGFECELGVLSYLIPEQKEKSDNNDVLTNYSRESNKLYNIPFKSDDPDYVYVMYYNNRLDDEAKKYAKECGYENTDTDEAVDVINKYKKEHLKTAEDFNGYFGGTIKVIADYKNGTSESAEIEVSVRLEETENGYNGYYVLSYK